MCSGIAKPAAEGFTMCSCGCRLHHSHVHHCGFLHHCGFFGHCGFFATRRKRVINWPELQSCVVEIFSRDTVSADLSAQS